MTDVNSGKSTPLRFNTFANVHSDTFQFVRDETHEDANEEL